MGTLKRVTGFGGVFFKARDPERLYRWYAKHLGVRRKPKEGGVTFLWRDAQTGARGMTVWALFPHDTTYFDPSSAPFMLNYRVHDLDGLLAALRKAGVKIEKAEDYPYGRFAWIMDPEGNRIELWEPPKPKVKAARKKARRKK